MGWLTAQGAIMAIGLLIGLVCSVIGLFFGISFSLTALLSASPPEYAAINSSGTVPCDWHCNIPAVVAAKYQHRLLARRRAAHADLCSGVRAAGLLHFRT